MLQAYIKAKNPAAEDKTTEVIDLVGETPEVAATKPEVCITNLPATSVPEQRIW